MEKVVRKKCIVMNCANHTDEGKFVGDMCSPCHTFVTSGRGVHSQAYRNSRQIEHWKGVDAHEAALHVARPRSRNLL